MVKAPRLIDAPSALECVVTQILQPLDRQGRETGNWMVFGEVVGMHIHEDYLTADGRFDSAKAALMARCGYMDYAVADHILAKARPKPA